MRAIHGQLPTPLDSAVPSSVLSSYPIGSNSSQSHGVQTPRDSGSNEEQSSLVNPQTFSWWSEIIAQIEAVDYLSTVDMSVPKSVLRNPTT